VPVPLPHTINNGDPFDAVPLMADLQVLADHFSGAIVNDDCSTEMGLDGAKVALASIPGDRLKVAAVGATQLATDAVITAKIQDGAVTVAKLATGVGKVVVATATFNVVIGLSNLDGFAVLAFGTYPKDTYDLVGAFVKNVSLTTGARAFQGATVVADDTGANWAANIYVTTNGTALLSQTCSGAVVLAFQAR